MKTFLSTITSYFSSPKAAEKDDFSRFFHDAKSREKKRLIKKVMREATAEQEKILKEYRKKTV